MGNFIIWKQEYSLGIENIDNQHKRLIDIINELYSAFMEKSTEEKLLDVLYHLLDYTKYHFSTEEQLLVSSSYEMMKEHIAEHEEFINKVNGFIEDYNNGKKSLTYKLMGFLNSWLVNHIQDEDKKYIGHVQKYILSEKHNA